MGAVCAALANATAGSGYAALAPARRKHVPPKLQLRGPAGASQLSWGAACSRPTPQHSARPAARCTHSPPTNPLFLVNLFGAEIPLPNEQARLEILKIHAGPIAKAGEIDYEAVVKLSDGFNGADLRNVCTEAG